MNENSLSRRRSSGRRGAVCAIALAALVGLGGCAAAVVGTGAAVGTTAAQERGVKGAMDDQKIRLEINDLWFKESLKLYSEINLQVQEGRVLLTGNVPDPETRVNAVRLAWQANGVREVINEIEVKDESSLSDAAQDTWIGTKLRARMIADGDIKSRNYSIEVVNDVIYLIGVAQDQAELDRALAHARDISYVKRVVNYVRIKEPETAGS